MNEQANAENIIESLRKGIPPKNGVSSYSVGNEKLLEQIKKRHLKGDSDQRGKIRFVSGSWGSGKSHFLYQLKDLAYESNYLVSSFGLSENEAPFDKFERVFYQIIREISCKEMQSENNQDSSPLGEVFRLHLMKECGSSGSNEISGEELSKISEELMQNTEIDIDFRRLVCRYWETFLPDSGSIETLEETRGQIMQWFSGEASSVGEYRKKFGVQKTIKKDNARLLLKSLGRYAAHAGYAGIVILLDEAEMSYSVFRKSALKKAHNNLLHLINNIEESPGLFLVYATTPDFYTDEKHGIPIYGALAQRIGRPTQERPRALDRIWNLDLIENSLTDYQDAACKLRSIYIKAYPDEIENLSNESELKNIVQEFYSERAPYSNVGFWRFLVQCVVEMFDLQLEGDEMPPKEEFYESVLSKIKDS